MIMKKGILQILTAGIFLLAGCAVGPKYEPPALEMPCQWENEADEGLLSESSGDFIWWEAFNDPVLICLIEQASEQNLDLYIAAERILEARTAEKGGKAALFPHLDGSLACGHVQYDKKVLNKIVGASCCKDDLHSSKGNVNFFEAGFDASWEIDLFGKRVHELNALKAQTESAEFDYDNVWVSLSSEVAKNYIELRLLQQSLSLLNQNIVAQQETHQLAKDLMNTGFSNFFDLKQAEAQLITLQAQKPQLELEVRKTIHRISILLGYNPGGLYTELVQEEALPSLPCIGQIGIPSELLRRRPDIRKAERDLAAATERVGSAVADLFPRISLNGFIGDIAALNSGGFLTGYAGSQALFPLLNSSLIEQDIDINSSKAQQAMYQYQKTVLQAIEEVENALASLHYETERNGRLLEALQADREAYDMLYQLYQRGLKDYLAVQASNRSYLDAEDAYLQSQAGLLQHYIALYKALGGAPYCNTLK